MQFSRPLHSSKFISKLFAAFVLVLFLSSTAFSQVPSPSDVFGFQVGADYKLANYDMMLDYYSQLDAASDRVQKIQIGTSSMGRPMILLFISSEENMQNLDRWRSISEQLSRARIDSAEAKQLALEGKAIVWVDGGMHATELAHGQMTAELAYKMATEETPEMQGIRENVVTLLMPVMNPDGLDIVASWYNENLGTPYETTSPPWLYQQYVGHDNNRDWFMNNLPETYHVNEILYRDWYPQIVYNHHQTSPSWARILVPPYSEPVNPNIHPGVTTGVNEVGAAMAQRFALKEMPGVITDTGYTMFWNGGGRTTPYYHNQIGILTETAHATPTPRTYNPEDKPETIAGHRTDGTSINYPYPWEGGESHFRDAVEYMLTGTMAVLEIASDRRSDFLFNIYKMGRDAIQAGESDPYAYVFSPDQWDDGEARNLLNILYQGGIEIHQASESFTAGGSQYDEGTYLIYSAQAYRPFLIDMMEPQNYPTLRQYPGGPIDPPYDLAGWTLPMQMGINVNRINSSFDVNASQVDGLIPVDAGTVAENPGYGFSLSPRLNNSIKAVNQLLEQGVSVYRAEENVDDNVAGTFIFENTSESADMAAKLSDSLGIDFMAMNSKPAESALRPVDLPRVGLYKSWQANMDEGWTRWVIKKNYNFAVDTLHDANMQNDDLSQYDAIILPDQWPQGILHGHSKGEMPEKYTGGMGLEGATALSNYVKNGGTLLTFDSASDFAIDQFGLPVRNVTEGYSSTQFFIPGSLIRMNVDTNHPLAHGMQDTVAASFSRSSAFEVFEQDTTGEGGIEDIADAPEPDVEIITRYAEDDLLMSGFALGAERVLGGKAAMIDVKYGEGEIILYGFRPQFRGQPRATYKLIFNVLYGATMEEFPSTMNEQ